MCSTGFLEPAGNFYFHEEDLIQEAFISQVDPERMATKHPVLSLYAEDFGRILRLHLLFVHTTKSKMKKLALTKQTTNQLLKNWKSIGFEIRDHHIKRILMMDRLCSFILYGMPLYYLIDPGYINLAASIAKDKLLINGK